MLNYWYCFVICKFIKLKIHLICSGAHKNVLLLSSAAVYSARIMDATEKLYIINWYNFTMNGTDRY